MKYIFQLIILLFVSGIITTCDVDTFPYLVTTQTDSYLTPEVAFGTVSTKKSFGIRNNGTGTLTWNISENVSWLATDKTTGNTKNDTAIVTVTANRDGMHPGVHKGNIEITGDNNSITIAVTMVVAVTGTFIDSRDNHTYQWVQIGEQIWISENLAWLPEVSPPADGSFTAPFYYVNGYEGTNISEAKATENYKTYGVLYNWPAALEACPNGWHLPSKDEWEQLAQYVNTELGPYSRDESRWTDGEGEHLAISWGWLGRHLANFGDGTNDFGFSGNPGGNRGSRGNFGFTGYGHWWSAVESSNYDYKAWGIGLAISYGIPEYFMGCVYRDCGNSVRCIKD